MKRRFNGNRTSGADGYAYDVENQLVQIEEASSWKTELVYDGRQRLRIVRDYYWSGGTYQLATETRYLYDGMNLIQQRTSSGHPTVTYTRGRDLSGSLEGAGGIGGLLARSTHAGSSPYQPNAHAFYQADGNGNVTYLRRSDGNYAAYKYDPFGRTLATSGTLAAQNLLRFSSKPWIQNSYSSDGLYYYGYRFYDPTSQRWLNRDPIKERGGINLYTFVFNAPQRGFDPYGLTIRFSPDSSPEFIEDWRACFCALASGGPAGAALAAAAAGPDIDIEIAPFTEGAGIGSKSTGSPSYFKDPPVVTGYVEILLNPNQINGLGPRNEAWPPELPPNSLAGCAVVLAHELGHGLYGEEDEHGFGFGGGRNVSNYENPVRREQGIEIRGSYHGAPILP